MPEQGLMVPNKDGSRLLNVNRFMLFARLSQYYAVESVSRALDYRLTWHRNNQSYIFGGTPQNLRDETNGAPGDTSAETSLSADREVYDNSNPSFLSGKVLIHNAN
jgi:hypothetical protein